MIRIRPTMTADELADYEARLGLHLATTAPDLFAAIFGGAA